MKLFLSLLCLPLTLFGAAATKIPAGYELETIPIPEKITLGVGGLAFAPDGALFICTREGEVWRFHENRWQLFADGLHEALGLHIDPKSGEVWVMQRPELTKLVDENGDGRADLYQTVNASWGLTDNYHEYAFGPVRDAQGNFYGTLNTSLSWPGWAGSDRWDIGRVHEGRMGRAAKYRGWAFQITPQGKFVPWASGLRSPAGIGWNSEGDLFFTDNQGDWVATSTLQHLVKGRFYEHPSSLMDHPDYEGKDLNAVPEPDYAKIRTPPAVHFPQGELANSPGEPRADDTGGKFGPFSGQIFVGDQTRSNLMRVYLEKVGGEYQGIVFNFIEPLQSGVIRNIFAADGSLWIGQTGRGWRSTGPKIYGLQRVVWDGKTIPMEMQKVNVTPKGFRVTFTRPVNREQATRPGGYRLKHWHYHYHSKYGSPKVNETAVTPSAVTLSEDGLVAELELPLIPRKIYQITLADITSADGMKFVNSTGYYTLNQIPQQ